MVINKEIKRLRLLNHLTQQALAGKLNISQNAYSLIENGKTKIDIHRIRQFAEIFNVPSSDLLIDITLSGVPERKPAEEPAAINQPAKDNTEEMLHFLKEQLKTKDRQIEQLIYQLEQVRSSYAFFYQHLGI